MLASCVTYYLQPVLETREINIDWRMESGNITEHCKQPDTDRSRIIYVRHISVMLCPTALVASNMRGIAVLQGPILAPDVFASFVSSSSGTGGSLPRQATDLLKSSHDTVRPHFEAAGLSL